MASRDKSLKGLLCTSKIVIKKLEAISTAITIIAVYLISEEKYLVGWSLNLFADILWVWFAKLIQAYYLLTLQVVLAIIATNGIMNAL